MRCIRCSRALAKHNGIGMIFVFLFRCSRSSLTFSSTRIESIRSGMLDDAIKATIDLADNWRVTSSGHELQIEMIGTNVDSFRFDSHPSNADGYKRLMSRSSGCNRDGRSSRLIASLAISSSDKKKSYRRGYLRKIYEMMKTGFRLAHSALTHLMKNIRPVILFLMFKLSDCLVR